MRKDSILVLTSPETQTFSTFQSWGFSPLITSLKDSHIQTTGPTGPDVPHPGHLTFD